MELWSWNAAMSQLFLLGGWIIHHGRQQRPGPGWRSGGVGGGRSGLDGKFLCWLHIQCVRRQELLKRLVDRKRLYSTAAIVIIIYLDTLFKGRMKDPNVLDYLKGFFHSKARNFGSIKVNPITYHEIVSKMVAAILEMPFDVSNITHIKQGS